jgi:hypothetical protein
MMELLLASMKAMQEKMDANQDNQAKTDANRKADQEHVLEMLAKMESNQERRNASQRGEIKSGQAEMRSTVSAIEGKMEAAIHSLRAWRKDAMSCQEMTEVRLECKKPNPEDMKAVHEEVPKEHTAVKLSED